MRIGLLIEDAAESVPLGSENFIDGGASRLCQRSLIRKNDVLKF